MFTTGQTEPRLLNRLLGFTIIGLSHWFFGNLYETVVFTPNTLANPAAALTHWNAFMQVSNPVWYFIPMSPLTFLAAIGAYLTGRHSDAMLRKWLLATLLLTLVSVILTVYIVTQINLKVFFSGMNLIGNREEVNRIVWNGIPFGLMRIISVGAALYSAVRAYLRLQ